MGASSDPMRTRLIGDAAGLTQFGCHLERLPPGSRSSHRHWHETEDELVYVLAGRGGAGRGHGDGAPRRGRRRVARGRPGGALPREPERGGRALPRRRHAPAADTVHYPDADSDSTSHGRRPPLHRRRRAASSPNTSDERHERRPRDEPISPMTVDADGVAVITWDVPGKSMNVMTRRGLRAAGGVRGSGAGRSGREGHRHHLRQGDFRGGHGPERASPNPGRGGGDPARRCLTSSWRGTGSCGRSSGRGWTRRR